VAHLCHSEVGFGAQVRSSAFRLDPCKQKILVERKAGAGFVSRSESSGRVESTVVPGFWIEASWLRQDELPSTMSCFREILGS